jgi:hypothetical protein
MTNSWIYQTGQILGHFEKTGRELKTLQWCINVIIADY